jgi:hypothetical protein
MEKETETPQEVSEFSIYAWVGRDEFGSGKFGLKQGIVPAGVIPMVSTDQEKLDKYWEQAEGQAVAYDQKIYLVKLSFVEVVRETKRGV